MEPEYRSIREYLCKSNRFNSRKDIEKGRVKMAVTVHKDVVCAFCGCLCDDLEVEVEDNKIKKVGHVCAIGRK